MNAAPGPDDTTQEVTLQTLLGRHLTPRHQRRREEALARKRRRAERAAARPEAVHDTDVEALACAYPLLYDRYVGRYSVTELMHRWGIGSRAEFHRQLAAEVRRLRLEVMK